MTAPGSLIAELEAAVQSGSRDRRVETLRRVADLFLGHADQLNDAQIALFDDVLLHLVKRVRERALTELSNRIAAVENAPPGLVRDLAQHDAISVAAPVLQKSRRLTNADLIDIAGTKGQEHLWAIAKRETLDTCVTDVLVGRGDQRVVHTLTGNQGASFSDQGFSTIIRRAERDESLMEKIGMRLDLPLRLLRELLLKATEAVRQRLLVIAPLAVREDISRIVSSISSAVIDEASAPRAYDQARDAVQRMRKADRLDEAAVAQFAAAHRYEELVASLTELCSSALPLVEMLMQNVRHDGVLILGKAAGLHWPTVQAILKSRFSHHSISDADLQKAKEDFLKLTRPTAQRVLRHWQVRHVVDPTKEPNPSGDDSLMAEMLRALGLDPAILGQCDAAEAECLREACRQCGAKARCRDDLASGRAASAFTEYCPNAPALEKAKAR